jgi:hypothetical protein
LVSCSSLNAADDDLPSLPISRDLETEWDDGFGLRTTSLRHLLRCRASSAASTGVRPFLTTCLGPRTDIAGFIGRIWPITSQSNGCQVLFHG